MTLAALMTALALADTAAGQPASPSPPPSATPASLDIPDFDTLDVNHDGRVTKEEFLAPLPASEKHIGERVFAARDANKDGVLTRDEMPAAPKR